MNMRRSTLAIASVAAVLALTSCGASELAPGSEAAPTPSPSPSATPTPSPSPSPTPSPTPTPTPSVTPASAPTQATPTSPAADSGSDWDLNGNGICDPGEALPPAPADGTWSEASEHGCQYDPDLQAIWDEEERAYREQAAAQEDGDSLYEDEWSYWPDEESPEVAETPSAWVQDQWDWAVEQGYACDHLPGTTYDPETDSCQ